MDDEILLASLVSAAVVEVQGQIEDSTFWDDRADREIDVLLDWAGREFEAVYDQPPGEDDWPVLIESVGAEIQQIASAATRRAQCRAMEADLDRRVRLGLVKAIPGEEGRVRYILWRH